VVKPGTAPWRQLVDDLTMQPALASDVSCGVGPKQGAIFGDAAPATVDPW